MFSLVTACKNREAHLRQALPVWLRLPRVAEIVVVDWSNDRPLLDLTALDPRLRVVRVEDEPRWNLSCAYNLGLAEARQPLLFKCDADCLPHPEVTGFYTPGPAHFFAGHWRSGAAAGRASANGQCLVSKAQFERVNGFSEYIRSWGRDDQDFYERLGAAGFARREIRVAFLEFIEHADDDRLSQVLAGGPPPDVETVLRNTSTYQEMFNYRIGQRLPWGPDRPRATFVPVAQGERWTRIRRANTEALPYPPDIAADARLFALQRLVELWCGVAWPQAAALDDRTCLRRLAAIRPPARAQAPPRARNPVAPAGG